MTSSSPTWDVDLQVGPSRFFRLLTAALHGAALLALASSGLPRWGIAAAAVAVLVAGVRAWRAEGLVAARLRLVGEEWWLEAGGRRGMVQQRRGRAWRWLVVLELEGEWRGRRWREKVVVWPDSVGAEAFRRLRVWLRLAPHRKEDKPDAAHVPGTRPAGGAPVARKGSERAGAARGQELGG